MSARGSDQMFWVPVNQLALAGAIAHWCPMAVVLTRVTRDQLDPMALGTCRYCGERLPVSPDKEKVASDA